MVTERTNVRKGYAMKKISSYDDLTGFIIENRASAYRLAYSYVHNKEDALDIIQDAICKALSSARTLQDPLAVKPWFFRIIVNTALDFLRKNKRYVYVEEDMLESLSQGADDQYENFDLVSALEKLSSINKTIVMLRFYEDMKLEDIAGVLNMNVSTVKTRLYTSLKKLRIEMEDAEDSESNPPRDRKGDGKNE